MEEASVLANSVGILVLLLVAKRMLAVGSTESLPSAHTRLFLRDDIVKARGLMALIPGSRMADDVATPEVPIESEDGVSLGQLFDKLSSHNNALTEYTMEKTTVENVFFKVIRENNVREEARDNDRRHRSW